MVTSATSLTRNGLSDFIVQRVSAIVLALYTICVAGFLLVNPGVSHEAWLSYHSGSAMRLFSTLALISLAAHVWIGMWTIGTDYIRQHYFGARATLIRGLYQVVCAGALFLYSAWGLEIFWRL